MNKRKLVQTSILQGFATNTIISLVVLGLCYKANVDVADGTWYFTGWAKKSGQSTTMLRIWCPAYSFSAQIMNTAYADMILYALLLAGLYALGADQP